MEYLAQYNTVFREYDELYRALAQRLGMPEGAFWILYALRDLDRPLTQRELCRSIGLPKQTVSSALGKLVEEGVVQCSEGQDRRNKYVALTPEGLSLAARTVDRVRRAEIAGEQALSLEERAALLMLLRRYCGALKEQLSQLGKEKSEE